MIVKLEGTGQFASQGLTAGGCVMARLAVSVGKYWPREGAYEKLATYPEDGHMREIPVRILLLRRVVVSFCEVTLEVTRNNLLTEQGGT